jgi:hypothetical protein
MKIHVACLSLVLLGACRSSALSGSVDLAGLGDLKSGSQDLATLDLAMPTQTSNTTQDLLGVWGSSATDVYIVGRAGTILHSSGDGQWTAQTSGVTEDLEAIWGSSASDIYVAGMTHVLHSTGGGTWTVQSTPSPGNLGVWGSGPSDIYAGGLFALAHSTGDGTWTAIPASESDAGYFSITGSGPNDVWAIGGDANGLGMGSGGYEHFDGSWAWNAVSTVENMKGVAFTSAARFIVGNGGLIYSDHGSGFVKEVSNAVDDLNAVWAAADGTVFAVGGSGTALTSTGDGSWSGLSTPSALPLAAVWGTSAQNVYAVGMGGEIIRLSN